MLTVRISLPVPALTRIDVYDDIGRHVETLQNSVGKTGENIIQWNASSMPSGSYFVRLQTNRGSAQQKVELIK